MQPQDLWARMSQPRSENKIGLTALTNRQEKVREDNDLISWTERDGGDKLRQAVLSRLSQQDRANNTTRNFRGLTRAELETAKTGNKGSAASQSKSRTHQARIAREKAAKEELDRRARERQANSEEKKNEENEEAKDEEEEEGYHEDERRDVDMDSDNDSDADAEGDTTMRRFTQLPPANPSRFPSQRLHRRSLCRYCELSIFLLFLVPFLGTSARLCTQICIATTRPFAWELD